MPWIDADFAASADPSGEIYSSQRLTAPASGKLRRYRIKTTTGCIRRAHDVRLTVTRSDDPGETLEIDVTIPDCAEVDNEIDPPYRVRARREYDVQLRLSGFSPDEHVEGTAGVFYTLFLDLEGERMPEGISIRSKA